MSVDNGRVHDIIQTALDNHSTGRLLPRLEDAWQEVNTQRSQKCGDYNLAAADHYLIMRYLTARFSPAIQAILVDMVLAYDGAYKGVSSLIQMFGGGDIVFRTGNCPATGFSPLVIAWGMTGIADGSVDCTGPVFQTSPRIAAPGAPALYFGRLF